MAMRMTVAKLKLTRFFSVNQPRYYSVMNKKYHEVDKQGINIARRKVNRA